MFDDYMERKGVWDNNVWTDINGVMRYIKNMNSMHLCFVYKQCELSKSRGIRQNRLPIIRNELQQRVCRGEFSKAEFLFHLEAIRLGLYCFYDNESEENEYALDQYYMAFLNNNPSFTMPEKIFKEELGAKIVSEIKREN